MLLFMEQNPLRESIDNGEPSIGTRIMNTWPGVIETLGQTDGFEYVEFLGEYAPWTLHDLENIARTSELVGLTTMIKVDGANREFIAQRAMAAGIQNLLFADIRTREDAIEAVNAVRPEPEGKNGVRSDRRNGYVGGYASPEEVVQWCDDAVIAIMVEKESAVDNLENILDVDGIDMVVFGAADYSLSIGKPGADDAEIRNAEEKTIATALEKGVAPRAEINRPEDAKRYIDLGVKHFNLNSDLNVLHTFWEKNGATLRDELDSLF